MACGCGNESEVLMAKTKDETAVVAFGDEVSSAAADPVLDALMAAYRALEAANKQDVSEEMHRRLRDLVAKQATIVGLYQERVVDYKERV